MGGIPLYKTSQLWVCKGGFQIRPLMPLLLPKPRWKKFPVPNLQSRISSLQSPLSFLHSLSLPHKPLSELLAAAIRRQADQPDVAEGSGVLIYGHPLHHAQVAVHGDHFVFEGPILRPIADPDPPIDDGLLPDPGFIEGPGGIGGPFCEQFSDIPGVIALPGRYITRQPLLKIRFLHSASGFCTHCSWNSRQRPSPFSTMTQILL